MSRVHRRRRLLLAVLVLVLLLLGARGALPSRVAGLTDAEIGLFYANAFVSVMGFCSFLFYYTFPDETIRYSRTGRTKGPVR